ncbi:MAG: hypothetical protein AABX59_03235, partial [Nanoarchaeota archaeon]
LYFIGVPYGASLLGVDLSVSVGNGRRVLARKEPAKRAETLAEKYFSGRVEVGDRVIFLEDVLTTGDNLAEQISRAREVGLEVDTAIALVDRRETAFTEGTWPNEKKISAVERFAVVGVSVLTITNVHSLIPKAVKLMHQGNVRLIEDIINYYARHGVDLNVFEKPVHIEEFGDQKTIYPNHNLNNKLLQAFIEEGLLTMS